MPPTSVPVSVVVLGYGDEPWLDQCLRAVLADLPLGGECVLVDNGITGDSRHVIPVDPRLTVVTPVINLGFAEGCNEGVRHTHGEVLVFVNSDAIIAPGAITALVAALDDPTVGLVTGLVRLGDRPDIVNAAGNPMHYLGYTWAGGLGDLATDHLVGREVTCISGATFAVRRDFWDQLGGFDREYFAYGEDVDLSIRTWQAGRRVLFVPEAESHHHYSFSRNPHKWFLVERGRLINVLTLFEPRTRRYVMPMLVAVEVGSLATATAQGWGGAKLSAWRWAWDNRDYLRARASRVAHERVLPDADILPRLRSRVEPPKEFGQRVPPAANAVLDRYWAWASRRLGVTHSEADSGAVVGDNAAPR